MPRRGGSSWEGDGRRVGVGAAVAVRLLLVAVLVALVAPTAAGAESPTEVAAELAVDGVYVAPGRTDIDEVAIAAAIESARAVGGLRLVAVAPADPQPDAAAFARRVQEASDADAAIVFPPEGGFEAHVIDKFADANLRAMAAARSKSTPAAAVETFSTELIREPERQFPPIIRRVVLVVLGLAVLLVLIVTAEQVLRRQGPSARTGLGGGLLDQVRSTARRL